MDIFNQALVVEEVQADAGIDIGDTFIGMHIRAVGIPVRSQNNLIGQAHVTMIKRRPKFIGGQRAKYLEAGDKHNETA